MRASAQATPKKWLEETFLDPVVDEVMVMMTRLSGIFLLCIKGQALAIQLSSPSSSAELKPAYALVAGSTWAACLGMTFYYGPSMKKQAYYANLTLQTLFGGAFLISALKPEGKV